MNYKKYIFLFLYIISVIIFYVLALQNGDNSASESGRVTAVIIKILTFFTGGKKEFDFDTTHNIVRKLVGHYGYSVLMGFLGYMTIYCYKGGGKITLVIALLLGLFISITSELIQFIPDNRGPGIIDMMIDFAGEETGILVALILMAFVKRSQQKLYNVDK